MGKSIKLTALAALCLALCFCVFGCGSSQVERSSSESLEAQEDEVVQLTAETVYGETVTLEPTGTKNVLVIGDDSWEDRVPGKADMMLLLHVDFDKHSITELTIPRDTAYHYETGYGKLNVTLQQQDAAAQTRAVGEVIGEPVDFYVKVGFEGLEGIVDHLGGLDVDLPYDVSYKFYTKDFPDESFSAGEQTIDGWSAMVLSRSRKSYESLGSNSPDMVRQYVNRMMFTRLMTAAYSSPTALETALKVLNGISESNLPLDAQVEWAQAMGEAGTILVQGTTAPFEGGVQEAEFGTSDWLVTPDPEGMANIMEAVNTGGDLQAAVDTYQSGGFYENTPAVTVTEITVG